MKRVSIRWLLLGVAAVSLVLPVVAVLSLRTLDALLVRQTERELKAQGSVVAAAFQEAWSSVRGRPSGDPRAPWDRGSTYAPLSAALASTEEPAPAVPDTLPVRAGGLTEREQVTGNHLSTMLRNAQIANLSGVRVLALDGCALASSRGQIGSCFSELPEVEVALAGKPKTVVRERVSDEPAPPLSSFSRRGDLRVFVGIPVWNDGALIGAVLLSRTAESGLEWLFKNRKGLFFGALIVLTLTVAITIVFSLAITRPLVKMARILRKEGEDGPTRALVQMNAPLEIHALGVALDERARELEAKSRYVTEFAANVSHELKTPLTSIRGAVELLQDPQDTMSREQRARFLDNIDAAARRTERLVTRLLALARLEQPRSDDGEPRMTLRDYAARLSQQHGDGVVVDVLGNDQFDRSEAALDAAVGNLVENAMRYRRRAPVAVTLSAPTESHGLLHVIVEDDGPGVSQENQTRLFERFFTTERDRGGTGLGLAIVRATAQRHGGRATIDSSPAGTRAEVWL